MNNIYISAAQKSSGKTILSIGLAKIFAEKKIPIRTFKKGPDFIDPSWLKFASSKNSYNLDFNTQSKLEIKNFYNQKKLKFNIIEGNKGLYDGVDIRGSDSNAEMAKLLDAPVILILNCEGITRGIAPLIQGYINFDKKCNISGVILNNVASSRHESKLIKSINHYTNLDTLGSIRKTKDLISERHLGLIPSFENKTSEDIVQKISHLISESVDTKKILKIFSTPEKEPSIKLSKKNKKEKVFLKNTERKLNLGIIKDNAFGFYYDDDIENFERYGFKIKIINSLKDKKLPNIDALFIGGGFPEIFLNKLEKNTSFIKSIKNFINKGMPCYAECGGLMYLTKEVEYKKNKGKMVGIIDARCEVQDKPVGRGLVELKPVSHPWISKKIKKIRCHEFHHSNLKFSKRNSRFVYSIERGYGIDSKNDGLLYKNLISSFSHLRHTESFPWIKYFRDFVVKCLND